MAFTSLEHVSPSAERGAQRARLRAEWRWQQELLHCALTAHSSPLFYDIWARNTNWQLRTTSVILDTKNGRKYRIYRFHGTSKKIIVAALEIQFSCLLSGFSDLTRLMIMPLSSEVWGVVARAIAIRHIAITNTALIVLCLEPQWTHLLGVCFYFSCISDLPSCVNKGHLSQIQLNYICNQALGFLTAVQTQLFPY